MRNPAIGQNRIPLAAVDRFFPISVDTLLFYIAFSCYSLWSALSITTAESFVFADVRVFEIMLQVVCVISLGLKLAMQRYTFGQLACLISVGLVVGVSAYLCKSYTLLWVFAFVAAGQSIRIKPLAAISLVVSATTVAFAVLGSVCGDLSVVYTNRGGVIGARSSMGFTHPNGFGEMIFKLCIAWVVLRYPKMTFYDLLLYLSGVFIVIEVADSRTSAVGILLAIILVAFCMIAKERLSVRAISGVFIVVSIVLIAVSFYLMVAYDAADSVHSVINNALSGRPYYSNRYFSLFPPTLLGTDFSNAPMVYMSSGNVESNLLVDNAFCRLVIRYGYITTVIFLISILAIIQKAYRESYLGVCLIGLMICIVAGFSERYMLDFGFNYFLVALSTVLYSKPLVSLEGLQDSLGYSESRKCLR